MNEDGTLKEDALKEYLEQVNRIWQTQKDAIEETKKAYQMGDDWANSDRSGYTNIAGSITDLLVKVNTVAAGGLLSPEGLVYLEFCKKSRSGSGLQTSKRTKRELFLSKEHCGNQCKGI